MIASKAQLERLAVLMLAIKPAPTTLPVLDLQASSILAQALRSAQIWELPNLRRQFHATYFFDYSSLHSSRI